MFASGETKTFYPLVKTINDTFISFAFLSLVVLALLLPSFEPYLLYFPLILLLLSARGDREQASILDRIVSRVHYLIVPFVFTCLIRFVKELNEMRSPISKRKADLLYFLLTDRKVRQIREILFFCACTPSYYASFCLTRGFFYLNEIFITIFGMLCVLGIFGETPLLRVYSIVGLMSSVLQFFYVKRKERESSKYI